MGHLVDVNAFLGRYPFRATPGGSPAGLVRAMDRNGISQAWISSLAAIFWRDPTAGNAVLYETVQRETRFRPVPAIHPGLANWEPVLAEARERGAPCVRADPAYYGIDPARSEMLALAAGCGQAGLPLLMAVRLEDGRQRHPNDTAAELAPWDVRALLRADPRIRLLITHADRDFIEQVHFGSTPEEAARILWDICWIWGPPEDHLALLLKTVGLERFTFGTGMPLRLPENSIAKLDLLDLPADQRSQLESGNLQAFLSV
jgi:predicted TIM-barrel fold metal-dependent hydrolase